MFRRRILSRLRALRTLPKKRGLQTARDVAYFDFMPTERSTLDDFNGKSVNITENKELINLIETQLNNKDFWIARSRNLKVIYDRAMTIETGFPPS